MVSIPKLKRFKKWLRRKYKTDVINFQIDQCSQVEVFSWLSPGKNFLAVRQPKSEDLAYVCLAYTYHGDFASDVDLTANVKANRKSVSFKGSEPVEVWDCCFEKPKPVWRDGFRYLDEDFKFAKVLIPKDLESEVIEISARFIWGDVRFRSLTLYVEG